MKIVSLYSQKEHKKSSENYIELDSYDLELLSGFQKETNFFDIPQTKIGNKTVLEWFSYDDLSYWWFIAPIISGKYDEALAFVDRIFNLIKEHNPNIIKLNDFFDKRSIIKDICKIYNIKIKYSKKVYIFLIKDFIKNFTKKFFFKLITNKKKYKRLTIFKNKKKSYRPIQNPVILASAHRYRRPLIDSKTGEYKNQEFFIQPILDSLFDRKIPTLCIDLDYTFRGTHSILKERLNTKFNWIPVEVFLDSGMKKSSKNILNHLNLSFKRMQKHDLHTTFNYKGISLWNFLKPFFKELFFAPHLPTYIHLLETIEEHFRQIKPKAIVQVYEAGPFAKAIQIAGQRVGVKTIGIQHGMGIKETHRDYMHKEIKSDKFPLGNPIPDLTFVFGEVYKRILVEKGSYPPERVTVTGNPTLYGLEKRKNLLNKEQILQKYSIENKKIILVALSFRIAYAQKNNSDRVVLSSLYKSFRDDPEIIVLVRPHPGDKFDKNLLDELYPSKNFVLSQASLFEDLFISDIVIITYSSVGIEASLFEKPVICVKLVDSEDSPFQKHLKDLAEHDLAIIAPIDKLASTIESIPKGTLWEISKSQKRKHFMYSIFNFGNEPDLLQLILE